uniref:Uncharacterized protein n=1 Tax=Arundo donax TaxID=35708 RepID=A0A0A8YX76_ARUDO
MPEEEEHHRTTTEMCASLPAQKCPSLPVLHPAVSSRL